MRVWVSLLAVLVSLAGAPASAQVAAPSPQIGAPDSILLTAQAIPQGRRSPFAPPPTFKIGFRAFATFDRTRMTASRTFDAVIGSDQIDALGAGVEVTGVGHGVFVRFAFSRSKETGTRGFVFNNEFVSLGIPIEVEFLPIEVGAGWRQSFGRRGQVAGYGGAGGLLVRDREISDFAADDENVDEWLKGYVLFGGIDVDLYKGLIVGGEVQYRSVRDTPPANSILGQFNEKDFGGIVLRFVVGYKK